MSEGPIELSDLTDEIIDQVIESGEDLEIIVDERVLREALATTNGTTGPWYVWNTNYTMTATTNSYTLNDTWNTWITTGTGTIDHFAINPGPVVERTAEEIEAAQRRLAERTERWRLEDEERQRVFTEQQARRNIANAAARELLLSCLTDEQKRTYHLYGYFDVMADGRRFRIHMNGVAGNVAEIDDRGTIATYCIHPAGDYPAADVHLCQKLLLESDLAEFESIANRTQRRFESAQNNVPAPEYYRVQVA